MERLTGYDKWKSRSPDDDLQDDRDRTRFHNGHRRLWFREMAELNALLNCKPVDQPSEESEESE